MTCRLARGGWAVRVAWLLVGSCLASSAGSAPAADRRSFLFLDASAVDRARAAVKSGEPFRSWARSLVENAKNRSTEDLPPLETAWWEEARKKPWAETYPEIFHHTWIVPARWAGLARDCARASLLETGSALAAKGRRVLLALSDYTFEFDHYDVGMNYTVWGIRALEAYDILYETFGAAGRKRMDAFFGRMVEAVSRSDAYWVKHEPGGPLNNHYAWHKLCKAAYGLFYGNKQLVEEALHGPKGVDELMATGFRDDGLWVEGAIPYQFAATSPLVILAELLENAGYPTRLYRRDTGDGRSLEQAYAALFDLLLPDRTLPAVGDAYAVRPHAGRRIDWEVLYRRFHDPRFAWLLLDLPERLPDALFDGACKLPAAEAPPQASRLWPEHAYIALRSVEGPEYFSGRGWTVFATYGANPVHAHADKLSIQIFAEGHLWLPDCEAASGAEHAFSSSVQRELNRTTLCHNTLLVGGASQRSPGRRLDLLEYRVLPRCKRFTVGDLGGRLYPGVRQMRTCIVREEYVLDVFQVEADGERDLSWVVHVDGKPAESAAGPQTPAELPAGAAWRYLKNPRTAGIEKHFGETFRRGAGSGARGTFRVDVFLDGPARLVTCGFPRRAGSDPQTIPMRLVEVRKSAAWFVAVYRAGRLAAEPLDVKVERREDAAGISSARVNSFRHRLPAFPSP